VLSVAAATGRAAQRAGIRGWAASGWRGEARYVLALPLAFQIGVLPAASLVYMGSFGVSGSRPVLALCAALLVMTAGLGYGATRGVPVHALVLADTALAATGNLVLSTAPPPSARAVEVSWQYFAGCVALWTLARGVPSGLVAAAFGIPLRLAMFAVAGDRPGVGSQAIAGVGDAAILMLAVTVSAGVLLLLDRDAERLRTGVRRSLHDTVLQTLEAMALTLPGDSEHAARRLREVRAVAHAEAVALRRELSRRFDARATPGVVEGLIGLSTELARDGLRVRLDAADGVDAVASPDDGDGLTPQRRAAILAAAREALRNVMKHAGVAEALVRIWDEPAGLTVVIRDFGIGFEPAAHRPGFGLSESITARMTEVGGTASVGSRPGNGTSVTLWVPVEAEGVSR
jgi:signal transduction histidine kinase